MVDRTLSGVYPILYMPFDDRSRIDVEDLRKEVEFVVAAGVAGVGIAMGSEIFKLSEAERDLATGTVVEQARGRVKVVVHTGAEGTDLAVKLSRRAQELGVDALMAAPPTTIPVDAEQVKGYFKRISDAVDVPIFVQDIPGAAVAPRLVAAIAREAENACYAKMESPPTPQRVTQAKQYGGDELIVFGGAGGQMFLEELGRGSVGTMPGSAVPEAFQQAWQHHQRGQGEEAAATMERYGPLLRLLGQTLGISYHLTKEVLRLRGVFKAANVRHPSTLPEDRAFAEVRSLVERLELGSI